VAEITPDQGQAAPDSARDAEQGVLERHLGYAAPEAPAAPEQQPWSGPPEGEWAQVMETMRWLNEAQTAYDEQQGEYDDGEYDDGEAEYDEDPYYAGPDDYRADIRDAISEELAPLTEQANLAARLNSPEWQQHQADRAEVQQLVDDRELHRTETMVNDVATEYGRRAGMGSPQNVALIRALADDIFTNWREQRLLEGHSQADIDAAMQSEYGFAVAGAALEKAIPLAAEATLRKRMIAKLSAPEHR
jgi:hypothetical protein